MPKDEPKILTISEEVRAMQNHWSHAAKVAHQDWSEMKYTKGTNGNAQFSSKNNFEAYRRKVWQFHKYYLYRAKICGRIAEFLEGESEMDFDDIKQDDGKIIYDDFINPDILKNAGGRN